MYRMSGIIVEIYDNASVLSEILKRTNYGVSIAIYQVPMQFNVLQL